jgi:hypothetical protein
MPNIHPVEMWISSGLPPAIRDASARHSVGPLRLSNRFHLHYLASTGHEEPT